MNTCHYDAPFFIYTLSEICEILYNVQVPGD
jgi:hypothetical protein